MSPPSSQRLNEGTTEHDSGPPAHRGARSIRPPACKGPCKLPEPLTGHRQRAPAFAVAGAAIGSRPAARIVFQARFDDRNATSWRAGVGARDVDDSPAEKVVISWTESGITPTIVMPCTGSSSLIC